MKRLKLSLGIFSYVAILLSPLLLSSPVQAVGDQISLQCPTVVNQIDVVRIQDNPNICDLSVDKQVSVNGGAFVDADTSPEAAVAHVGDTVVWRVVVTNSSKDLTPHGAVYVHDLLPDGTSFQSYIASDGTYKADDGSFFANTWVLPLLKSQGESFVTTLPATLDITSKVTKTGLTENEALLTKYDPGSCDGGCVYLDADSGNDSNAAWINVVATPHVLAASTIVNTGDPAVLNFVAGISLLSALGLVTLLRPSKKKTSYKL